MEIDELIVGSTMKSSPNARRMMDKAPECEAMVATVKDDDLYLILLKDEKPVIKVKWEWAVSCGQNFLDDVMKAYEEAGGKLPSNQDEK